MSAVADLAQDPAVLLAELADWVALLDRHSHVDVQARGADSEVVWRNDAGLDPHAVECAFRLGALESLLGRVSGGERVEVEHSECAAGGAAACRYRVLDCIPCRDSRHARLLREVGLQSRALVGHERVARRLAALNEATGPVPDFTRMREARRFMEELDDIVLVFDRDLQVLDANAAACRFHGLSLEELRGSNARDLLSPQSAENVMAHRELLFELGGLRGMHFEARTRDGWAVMDVSARVAENRRAVICLARDITQRLQLERELAERNQELRRRNLQIAEADRLKSEFLANVTHELTTPLTCIKGFAKLLRGHFAAELGHPGAALAPEKRVEFVDLIESEADRMSELIRDLLDLSNIESGGVRLQLAPVDLNRLVDGCLQVLKPRIDEAGLSLRTAFADRVGEPALDAARVKQVVMNLVDNAIKFSPRGAALGVSTRARPGAVEIRVQNPAGELSTADLERVFGRFVQGDGSYRRSRGGVGLGLDLVRAIAQLHGGRAWAELSGAGTVEFACELPTGE